MVNNVNKYIIINKMNQKEILFGLLQTHLIQQKGTLNEPKKNEQYSAVSIILRTLIPP
jgi:hypothetical protein